MFVRDILNHFVAVVYYNLFIQTLTGIIKSNRIECLFEHNTNIKSLIEILKTIEYLCVCFVAAVPSITMEAVRTQIIPLILFIISYFVEKLRRPRRPSSTLHCRYEVTNLIFINNS